MFFKKGVLPLLEWLRKLEDTFSCVVSRLLLETRVTTLFRSVLVNLLVTVTHFNPVCITSSCKWSCWINLLQMPQLLWFNSCPQSGHMCGDAAHQQQQECDWVSAAVGKLDHPAEPALWWPQGDVSQAPFFIRHLVYVFPSENQGEGGLHFLTINRCTVSFSL